MLVVWRRAGGSHGSPRALVVGGEAVVLMAIPDAGYGLVRGRGPHGRRIEALVLMADPDDGCVWRREAGVLLAVPDAGGVEERDSHGSPRALVVGGRGNGSHGRAKQWLCGGGRGSPGSPTCWLWRGERLGFSWQAQTLVVEGQRWGFSWQLQTLVVGVEAGVLTVVPYAYGGGERGGGSLATPRRWLLGRRGGVLISISDAGFGGGEETVLRAVPEAGCGGGGRGRGSHATPRRWLWGRRDEGSDGRPRRWF